MRMIGGLPEIIRVLPSHTHQTYSMDVAKLAEGDVAGSAEGEIAQPSEDKFAEEEIPDLVEGEEPKPGSPTEEKEKPESDGVLQRLEIRVNLDDFLRPGCYYCKRPTSDRCGGCKACLFCSKDCIRKVFFSSGQLKSNRKGWRTHRLSCDPPDVRFGDVDKPLALWITLWKPSTFDELYSEFIKKLNQNRKGQLVEVTSELQLAAAIETMTPTAIILTDETLMGNHFRKLRLKFVQFARSGGVVIFCCFFAPRVEPPDQNRMWKTEWGLKWRKGDFHIQEYTLNAYRWSKLHGRDVKLPERKELKAFYLLRTEKLDAMYVSTREAEMNKAFWAGPDRGRSPVCYAHVGLGGVGYIGDEMFVEVIPVMCGLIL